MSLVRLSPVSEATARAAALLQRVEHAVALLDRVRPLNLESELTRLQQQLTSEPVPRFTYAPAAQLAEQRRALDELSRSAAHGEVELQLLGERATELGLEASLAEQVGAAAFRGLAERRFPLPPEHADLEREARACLLTAPLPSAPAALHLSDDTADPSSLWSLLVARIEGQRLPIRVELSPGLVPLAAVADGVVRVRPGARLSAAEGRRVAEHELEGHARPRLLARALGGVFLAGSRGGSEDEEGRAIWLEERAGLFHDERRRELWRRYLAAASVREGAELWQTVRLLRELGAEPRAALELSCRVQRGGGLGRELVYVCGYRRVRAAFARFPALARALGHGRVSVAATERLLGAGSVQLHDDRDVI